MTFHTVVSMEHGTYTVWQSELLAWTFSKAGETGPLTFLDAGGSDAFAGADTFETANYRSMWTRDYPPFNRPYGLRDWVAAGGPRADTVLLVDPDMAWIGRLGNYVASPGRAVAQHVTYMDEYARKVGGDPVGAPLFLHRDDLTHIVQPWIDHTLAVLKGGAGYWWIAEMEGYVLAAKEIGLTHELIDIDCGPIVHYSAHECTDNFDKNLYVPWAQVPVDGPPAGRRLAELINEYAGTKQ